MEHGAVAVSIASSESMQFVAVFGREFLVAARLSSMSDCVELLHDNFSLFD